jgi:hypothetical protein
MEELTPTQIARRSEIIKDIIKKRPELNGCSYTSEKYFDYDRNYERVRMIPSRQFFGYDPEELFTLGLNESGYQLRESLYNIFEKGITQKQNRFEERVCDPIRDLIRKIGITGLYSVRTSKGNLGFVHARDLAEAKRVADIAYGFVVAGQKDRWGDELSLSVGFRKQGTVAELNVTNQVDVDNIKEKIESARRDIEKSEKRIAEYENDLIAIQMSEMSQLTTSFEESAA